ncbi:MAG: DUF3987 domain-containing protein [Bacteroidales bacterium]|nr:DUF3987 domain-containing protein [Eubacteriales bacterium]MDD4669993.1 DUF3987 domain-containing protein [Bacteroidales bacterium]
MSKKTFNPANWQPVEPAKQISLPAQSLPFGEVGGASDLELVVTRIESASIDIAPNYADWRDLGFALADALGESGRNYYHRLSRFYPSYSQSETDKQYSACLASHGHGVTIKTLYHLAKSAGIDIAIKAQTNSIASPKGNHNNQDNQKNHSLDDNSPIPQNGEMEEMGNQEKQLPAFPKEIFESLPGLLQTITSNADSPEDADLLLLGSLTVFSACMPNVYGVYGQHEVFPNLFLFVTAKASAGKGRLSLCRRLVEPIHQMMRQQCKAEQEEYKLKLTQYNASSDKAHEEKPEEPPLRTLIIPANNSATGLFQLLKENNEKGLIFETEGDTLAQTFKSEHGNYSDGFRKAFHHETISYNRRKDREFVELASPQLSALLSGTPKQVSSLIPNAENGLFSRFMFYFMNLRPIWKDVFAGDDEQPLEHKFDVYGKEFLGFNLFLRQQPVRFRFAFSSSQQKAFNAYFEQTQLQYLELCGDDYVGSIRRLGLIAFRLAMIMTALRIIDTGEVSSVLVCNDSDFNTVMEIVKVLVLHAAYIFEQLPKDTATAQPLNHKRQLLDALPSEFDRQTYLAVAKNLNIPDKTAEKQITRFINAGLLVRKAHGSYSKKED